MVEDEEPSPREPLAQLGIRPFPPGEGEFVERAGDPVVSDGDSETVGQVAERAGEIRVNSILVAMKGSEIRLGV